ncbi:MAG: SGNH/GDSL hydrolase family protein [Planctomycetota bacterium]
MGYTVPVRETLAGKANVFRPLTNCGPTTRGVELVDEWLADRNWDIIHFNFGLHDLKFMSPDGKNLADPTDPNNAPQVPIDQYAMNLRVIIQKLQATGATLIWRETSPVPAGAKGRVPGDARRYNSAAADVVSAFPQIQTDEFYAFCLKHADLQRPANVHYSPEGSRLLAAHVSSVILQALSEKTVAHPPS